MKVLIVDDEPHIRQMMRLTLEADGYQVDEAADEYLVSSTVIMVEYREDQQRVFAGRQRHRLRRDGASFRIVQKRVELINCDSAFEAMAVPI